MTRRGVTVRSVVEREWLERPKTAALLHVGLTDAAIARQLGLGHRTVQRRLHALTDEVGAVTRFQLGWYAARAEWLDEENGNTVPPRRP
ncbi:hypothetical protein ACWCXX_32455 [Streptomyces sp. NPDC001732]